MPGADCAAWTDCRFPPRRDCSPKRRQIAQAAEALFLAHGYGAVSMDAVARQAGVSKATLYAHFASKDAAVRQHRRRQGRRQPGGRRRCFPTTVPDLRAALLAIGQRMLRFLLQRRTLAILRIAIAESARFPELGRAFYANGPQSFCDRFRAWLDELGAPGPGAHAGPAGRDRAVHGAAALGRVPAREPRRCRRRPTEAEIDATVTGAVETWLRAFGA